MLFFRLWSLQVLSGRHVPRRGPGEPAAHDPHRGAARHDPRPATASRSSTTSPGTAVKLWVGDLPKQGRYDVIKRLAWVLKVPPARLAKEVDQRIADPLNPITVKTAVGEDQVAYLYEHQDEFPGVQIQQTYLRALPVPDARGAGARLRRRDLGGRARRGGRSCYRSGDKVGKAGVESSSTSSSAARPARRRSGSTRSGARRARSSRSARRGPGTPCGSRSTSALQRAAERALRLRDRDRPGEQVLLRERRRARRARPARRRGARDGVDADVQAVRLRRPRRPEEDRSRSSNDAAAKKQNYPGINRVTTGVYPPGLDVEAGHRARGDAGAPARAVRVDPVHAVGDVRPRQAGVRELGPVRQPADDAARGARAVVRHVLLRRRLPLLPRRRRGPDADAGVGARVRLRCAGRASTSAARQTGLVPTPAWRKRTFTSDWDKAWNPGDSIQLAIGQKDVTVTPLQMARFYAMIANGGKLVTPYLVSEVETPAARGQSPVVAAPLHARPAARRRASTRPRSRSSATVSTPPRTRVTARRPASSAPIPIAIAGKTGTAEKVVPIPGYPAGPPRGPVVVVRLRAGADRGRAHRRLRGDRERRPRLAPPPPRRRCTCSSSSSA